MVFFSLQSSSPMLGLSSACARRSSSAAMYLLPGKRLRTSADSRLPPLLPVGVLLSDSGAGMHVSCGWPSVEPKLWAGTDIFVDGGSRKAKE
jgi:hypothetical protein